MPFEFNFKKKEANFGKPEEKEIDGGTHLTIEIILRHKGKFVMIRRPKGYPGHQLPPKADNYPNGCLYFSHDLPRWGESVETAVKRIVKSQLNTDLESVKVLDLTMETYPDALHEGNKQWAITLYVMVELMSLPKLNKDITEIIQFDLKSIPDGMGW